ESNAGTCWMASTEEREHYCKNLRRPRWDSAREGRQTDRPPHWRHRRLKRWRGDSPNTEPARESFLVPQSRRPEERADSGFPSYEGMRKFLLLKDSCAPACPLPSRSSDLYRSASNLSVPRGFSPW